ncbi:hypothetical protein [Kingella potus]|uniref:hypothetical protein n=1 Tax=Kingella potus TaxID=265175 RepID=UPI001FCFDCB5|nr:hypothetical protein [Kingella potus]UOP00938.1 hypothetical protein LVJ84_00520 [Kingella potus]
MPAASPSKQTARTAGGRGRLKMPERNFGTAPKPRFQTASLLSSKPPPKPPQARAPLCGTTAFMAEAV